MMIGYARVSTLEQNLDLQQDALQKAGCEKIFVDQISGAKQSRPGLDALRHMIRKGDTLVVWRLDRLSRTMKELLEMSTDLEGQGIHLKSLQESIDTTTSAGKLIFHMFSALAEFERNLIRERTMAGLAAARARGRMGGRRQVVNAKQQQEIIALHQEKKLSVKRICELYGISRQTLYNYLKA